MGIPGFTVMSEVEQRPVEWLWDGYIPLGEMTILEGHPGGNKSSLADDLAARVTTGRAMPCSPLRNTPADRAGVVFLIGEDSISKAVRGRLDAAGADLTRIAVLDDVFIPRDTDMLRIEEAIIKVEAKLVVVDTLNDFLDCNLLGNQQVRKALRPLRKLSERKNVGIVGVRHFVKVANGHSLLRGGGSVGITAVARSQLKLYQHPDDRDMRVLIQDKSSLGPLSPALMFKVVPVGNNSFRLEWHGECQFTAEDLERKHKGRPALAAAEKFLVAQLGPGPKEVNALIEAAKGICSKRTLDEAKRSLGVETARQGNGKNHKVFWQIHSLQNSPVQGVEPLVADDNSARSEPHAVDTTAKKAEPPKPNTDDESATRNQEIAGEPKVAADAEQGERPVAGNGEPTTLKPMPQPEPEKVEAPADVNASGQPEDSTDESAIQGAANSAIPAAVSTSPHDDRPPPTEDNAGQQDKGAERASEPAGTSNDEIGLGKYTRADPAKPSCTARFSTSRKTTPASGNSLAIRRTKQVGQSAARRWRRWSKRNCETR